MQNGYVRRCGLPTPNRPNAAQRRSGRLCTHHSIQYHAFNLPLLPLRRPQQQNQQQLAPLEVLGAPIAPAQLHTVLASSSRQQALKYTVVPAAAWATQAEPAAAIVGAGLQTMISKEKASSSYVPSSSAVGRAQQLTAYISSRRHWSQLQNIWLDNSSSFSDIHLTAALTRMARLVEAQGTPAADGPELFKFSSALMSCIHQRIPELDPRGAAQSLWAYAKLQACSRHYSSSGDAAADALMQHIAAHHLKHLRRQELSQVSWAVARLQPQGLTVPVTWWAGLEQRLLELLPEMRPPEIACCAWALSKGQYKPTAELCEAIVSHVISTGSNRSCSVGDVVSGSSSSSSSSQPAPYPVGELLQLLLALGSWQYNMPASVMLHCQQQLQQQVAVMQPQDLSNTMLAFARLHWRPPQLFLNSLLQKLQQVLPRCCPRVLVTVPYAFAKLRLNPGDDWWAGFIPYTTVSLPSYCPAALAITAWSFARLDINPGEPWVHGLLQQSGHVLQQQAGIGSRISQGVGFAVQELALLAWALGKWAAAPPDWWWQAFEAATAARIQDFTAAELGALLNGMGNTAPALAAAAASAHTAHSTLAQLLSVSSSHQTSGSPIAQHHHHQHQHQHQHLHQQSQRHLQRKGEDCHNACHWYRPSCSWTDQVLTASLTALSDAPAASLAGILLGFSRLRLRPSSEWLRAYEAAAMAAMPAATCQDIAGILWGYSVLQVQPSDGLLHAAFTRIHGQLQQSWAAARSGRTKEPYFGSSSSSKLPDIVSRGSSINMPADQLHWATGSPATAAQLLWAVATLPVPVQAPWVDDMLVTIKSGLSSATCDTLVTLLWSLAKLQHLPGCKDWLDSWWDAYRARMKWQQQQQQRVAAAPNAPGRQQHAAPGGSHAAEPGLHHQLPRQQHQELLVQSASPATMQPDEDDVGLVPLLLVLSSFRRLRVTPSADSGWLQYILVAVQQHLPSASSAQLCLLLRQLAQLHVWPGEVWLTAAVDALRQRHCSLQDIEVRGAMRDLQTLGVRVAFDREVCHV